MFQKILPVLTTVAENGEEVVEETKTVVETLNGNQGVVQAIGFGLLALVGVILIIKKKKGRR